MFEPSLMNVSPRLRVVVLMLAFTVTTAVATAVAPTLAHADLTPAPGPAPTTDDAAAGAKRHFLQAVALYNDGNFDAALAEFLAAYRTKPQGFILYNIGLTYKSLFLYNDSIRTLEQYLREETKLAPERRAEVEQVLREMQALLAKVELSILPDGANVKVDGRTIGKAPIGQYLLAAGRHVLEVTADGYTPQTKEVMVTAGAPMALTITLAVIPKTGRIRIKVEPPGASLKVDGRIYPSPVDLELSLGGHTFEAWATGYSVHREELIVAPGLTRDVSVGLRRPPLGKRAAFIVPVTIGAILLAVGLGVGIPCGALDKCGNAAVISGTLAPGSAPVGR